MVEGFGDLVVRITSMGDRTRVSVLGDVDLASVATLRRALDAQQHAGAAVIELDASGISFCDSVGLSALLTARRDLAAAGRALRLVDPSPCVVRVLQLTATNEAFDLPG